MGFLGYVIKRSCNAEERDVENWYCGSIVGNEEAIFHSSSYYVFLKQYFTFLEKQYVPNTLDFKTDFSKVLNLDTWFYYPVSRGFISFSKWFAKSHVGIPQVYLLWPVIGAMITIFILFWLV